MSTLAQKRLAREVQALQKEPPNLIHVSAPRVVCPALARSRARPGAPAPRPTLSLAECTRACAYAYSCATVAPFLSLRAPQAKPHEGNILNFHYVLEGPPDSPYAGGLYHGVLKFPSEYPHKPPVIIMYTPSGRFQPNTPICTSFSSFHPEVRARAARPQAPPRQRHAAR